MISDYPPLLSSGKLESMTLWSLIEVKISRIVEEIGDARMRGGSCREDDWGMGDRSSGNRGHRLGMLRNNRLGMLRSNRYCRTHMIRAEDLEAYSSSSPKSGSVSLAIFYIFPKASADTISINFFLIFDTIFLISVVAKASSVLVSLVTQDLDM